MEQMDRLTPIFERFVPQIRVCFANQLEGTLDLQEDESASHIHWLRSGQVRIHRTGQPVITVSQPSVILVPSSTAHQLESNRGAEVMSAQFDFGQRYNNPLSLVGSSIIVVPIVDAPEMESVHTLLMNEVFSDRCGRSLAANQLMQYFLLILFRYLIQTRAVAFGPLNALADDKLMRAVTGMHRDPGKPWTLEQLADLASMSRATFARQFKERMGKTPADYLTDWRISVAQSLLAKAVPIKSVATEVGYSSAAVLTRIFKQRVGMTPKRWQATQQVELDLASWSGH